MKRLSASYLVKLAAKFERLAQMPPNFTPSTKVFYDYLKPFLGKDISSSEFATWLQNNATVLGGKLKERWYVNFENNLQSNLNHSGNSSKVVLITKSPILSESWKDDQYVTRDIVESSVLQSFKGIPTLYLYVIESFSLSETGALPKELAHEEYLVFAIKKLYGGSTAQILDFYNKNKKKIDKIRSLFHGSPEYLGGGADGVAFSMGKNFILKIFADNHSFESAKKAVQRLHMHPELAKTEAMIYDVGILGEFRGQEIYYYIMERMETVRSLDNNAQDAIENIAKSIANKVRNIQYSQLQAIKKQIDDPSKFKEIKAAVSTYSESMAMSIASTHKFDIKIIDTNLKLKPNWLKLFAEELIMKYLTGRTDLHLGNLGVTQQGELRYFDPAFSDWVSNINL